MAQVFAMRCGPTGLPILAFQGTTSGVSALRQVWIVAACSLNNRTGLTSEL